MSTIDELSVRIGKLEKQSIVRFAVEIILVPILLIAGKSYADYSADRAKEEFQRIELAQKMMPDLFKGDPYEAFASERLLSSALDTPKNRKVRDELRMIVKESFLRRVESYLKSGETKDLEEAERIVSAAKMVGGYLADDFLKLYAEKKAEQPPQVLQKLDNLSSAADLEKLGFQNLLAGKYDDAIAAFEGANGKVSRYHSVEEIAALLKAERNSLQNIEARKRIFNRIATEYSWKAPPDLIAQLKELSR